MRRITSLGFFVTLLFVGAGALNAQEKPAVPEHDMAGKDNCAMCHAEGVMGATKMPDTHGDDVAGKCGACHKPAG